MDSRQRRLGTAGTGRMDEDGRMPAGLLLQRRQHLLGRHQRASGNRVARGGVPADRTRECRCAAQSVRPGAGQLRLRRLGMVRLERTGVPLASAWRLRRPLAIQADDHACPMRIRPSTSGALQGRQVVPRRFDVHRPRCLGGRVLGKVPGQRRRRRRRRVGVECAGRHLRIRQAFCRQLQVGSNFTG